MVVSRQAADAWHNGMEYFNTYGGSTAAIAAGLATLTAVQEEGMMAKSAQVIITRSSSATSTRTRSAAFPHVNRCVKACRRMQSCIHAEHCTLSQGCQGAAGCLPFRCEAFDVWERSALSCAGMGASVLECNTIALLAPIVQRVRLSSTCNRHRLLSFTNFTNPCLYSSCCEMPGPFLVSPVLALAL